MTLEWHVTQMRADDRHGGSYHVALTALDGWASWHLASNMKLTDFGAGKTRDAASGACLGHALLADTAIVPALATQRESVGPFSVPVPMAADDHDLAVREILDRTPAGVIVDAALERIDVGPQS